MNIIQPSGSSISHSPRRQYGFSLLELVVVMGILAIFASVSLTFVGEKDVQQRYNESIEKLNMVKRNFFSVDRFQGQTVMHGFWVDNGMIDNLAIGQAVTNSFEMILKKPIQDNNHYMLFSFVDSIPVDVVTPGDTVIKGAGLYKDIRPGAYDLSEYRDSDQHIKDAWGDEYTPNVDDTSYSLSLNSLEYKNIGASKNTIDVNITDLTLDVSSLKVLVENLPANNTFKIALVTFNNIPCKNENKKHPTIPNVPDECDQPDAEDYWQTRLSNAITTIPSGNIFTIEGIDNDGLFFNNEEVKEITPTVGALNHKKLNELTLTTDNDGSDKLWSFSALATPNTFNFNSEIPSIISIGSHVLVLLKKSVTDDWELFEDESGHHIFEYLHIYPGQVPSPITLSIP